MNDKKTVYVVGAGFSHGYDSAKFPDMAHFCQNIKHAGLNRDDIMCLEEYLGQLFDDIRNIDIEDALAYCDLARQGAMDFKHLGDNKKVDNKLIAARLSEILTNYLDARLRFDSDIGISQPHIEWTRRLQKQDCIINFNWDLLLENLLLKYPDDQFDLVKNLRTEITKTHKASLTFRPSEKGFLLKLHGSLDWFICSNPACPNQSKIEMRDPKQCGFDSQYNFCRNCSSSLEQVIIYPGISKRYEKYPKITHLWKIAWQALWIATKIVVIGYSFRPQDVATSFLMRSSLWFDDPGTKEWVIIDPEAVEVQKRLAVLPPMRKSEVSTCTTHKDLAEYIDSLRNI